MLRHAVGAPDPDDRQTLAARAARSADHQPIGVLYIDLDGFKAVNDDHGHSVGDAVLAEVAARVSAAVRSGDVVARLGGDEFAVLCPEFDAHPDLTGVAERIIAAITEPISVKGLDVVVGASVGIATATRSQAGASPDSLVDLADQALYQAKADGRGRWHFAPTGAAGDPTGS